MKRTLFLTTLFLSLACATVFAQNAKVDDIIDSYLKNSGGVENWKALKSLKMTGTRSGQKAELPTVIYRMRDNKQRIETRAADKLVVQAYDGKDAWMVNPVIGVVEPTLISEEGAIDMKEGKFEDAFIDYKKKGHTAELVGTEQLNGAAVYKVKFTTANGLVQYFYFDTTTYLPLSIRTTVNSGPAKGMEIETILSDYKSVNGFVIPHLCEVRQNGQVAQKLTILSVTFNEAMDNSLFAMPKKQ